MIVKAVRKASGEATNNDSSARGVVSKWGVHTQVLRLRQEDSVIGHDVVKENVNIHARCRKVEDDDHVFIGTHTHIHRPASPLGRSQ